MAATNHRMACLLNELLDDDPDRSGQALAELCRIAERPDLATVEQAVRTAVLLLAVGQRDQACCVLESINDHCESQPMLLNNLAFAHMAAGRVERALALWRRAAFLAPRDSTIQSNLITLARQFGS